MEVEQQHQQQLPHPHPHHPPQPTINGNGQQQHQQQAAYMGYAVAVPQPSGQPEWLMGEGAADDQDLVPIDEDSRQQMLGGGGEPGRSARPKRRPGQGNESGVAQGPKSKESARISLADLKDCPPGVKPYHAYSTLIRYAIKGSPNGKLLLEDIYEALMLRFEYFRTAPPGWKNSVRHNLSLNPMFVKVERPLTDRGKGYYWTVKDEEGLDARTGVHRNRKKTKSESGGGGTGATKDRGGSAEPPAAPYPPPQYVMPDEASVAALQAHFNPYPRDQLIPEVAPTGEIDWQASWWNEITKLQQFTGAQEKASVGSDWYRWMFEHMRAAFGHPAVIGTGTAAIHVGQIPHPQQPQVQEGGPEMAVDPSIDQNNQTAGNGSGDANGNNNQQNENGHGIGEQGTGAAA